MQRELIYLFLQILYWYSVLIAAIVDEMELVIILVVLLLAVLVPVLVVLVLVVLVPSHPH